MDLDLTEASTSDLTTPSSSSLTTSSASLQNLNLISSINDSNSTSNPKTFKLSPILLVSTLNGELHALDRQTGAWNWTLDDPNQISSSLTEYTGLVDSPSPSSDAFQSYDDRELYAIEPWNDGDLYVFIKSPNKPSHLEKLPLSISQLVNLSPFTFPGDSSKMFIGKKETHMIAIDLQTGTVVDSLQSQPKKGSWKGKEKSSNAAQCNLERSFHLPKTKTDFDSFTCSTADSGTSRPIKFKADHNHQPINQRPHDLLYIGRTDYQVSIYSKPNQLIQTLRYSTYAPSNLPHGLQITWTRTPDELYLEPTHDGNLVCFQATQQTLITPPKRSERPKIKWENSFTHPVTSVFDIVFPDAPKTSSSAKNSADQSPLEHDPLEIPPDSTCDTAKATSPQQPIIFVQPKFLPHRSDKSQNGHSSDDQFDVFKHLHSQTTFSTPSQTTTSMDQERAFVGKYQESYYVMSRRNFPLVTFAPPALQTLGNELSVGTHVLLNSQAIKSFIDFSYTNRLLNPASNYDDPPPHPRLALDPTPHPLTLPTSEQFDELTPSLDPALRSAPSTISSSKISSTKKDIIPIQLHQRPAQISSLLVKTFKQQLLLSGRHSSHTNQKSDDRFLDLNPLVTFLLVIAVISWWASRKIESSSTTRWEHLFRLVNQTLGNGPKLEPGSNLKKSTGATETLLRPSTTVTPNTVPIDKSECRANFETSDKPVPDGINIPNSKQKPKRRRGKRPGQKAAAAAAKAQAELTNPQALVRLPSSLPDSMSPPFSTFKLLMSKEFETNQKRQLNVKKSELASIGTVVDANDCFDHISLSGVPKNGLVANDNLFKPVNASINLNDQVLSVNQHIGADPEPFLHSHKGREPARVGSLIVTNETIGYGSHGTVVFRGTFQGRQVAVKRLLKDFVTIASHEVNLLQESDDHPNVVRYFVNESLNNFLYIALELCNASLHDFIEKRHFEEFEELERIFDPKKALKQITSGLRYLHKLKIVHRDLKPQNILISLARPLPRSSKETNKVGARGSEGKRFRMLISDFGLCKKLELDESSFAQTANHAAGSFGYRAPEILKGQVNLSEERDLMASSSLTNLTVQNAGGSGVNSDSNGSSLASNLESTRPHRLTRSIDIFSLGCIFYYVITKGDHPFGSRYEREVNILKGEVWLDQLDGLDEETFEAQQLIRSMIRSNPKERPTAEDVLQNPYFWEASKRLNFLCDCSDRFESMERDPPEETLIKLENQNSFSKYLYHHKSLNRGITLHDTLPHAAKTFDWYKVIDRGLVDNLGKYRKYDSGSIRDLLRVMRNKKHHFQDLPEGIRRSLGDLPEGFLNYFSRKFPSLLVHVYEIVFYQSDLKYEKMFQSYFDVIDDI